MANELRIKHVTTGVSVKAIVTVGNTRWNGSAMVALSAITDANWAVGAITCAELLTSNSTGTLLYEGNMPAVTVSGDPIAVDVYFYEGNPTPGMIAIGVQSFWWDGTYASGAFAAIDRSNEVAILAKLNGSKITVVSPVAADNSIEIVQGDDYFNADGRALQWTVKNYSGPAVGGLTVTFAVTPTTLYQAGNSSPSFTVTGSAAMGGSDAVFKVELTAAQTGSLSPSPPADRFNYVYQLRAATGSGHTITEVLSSMTCKGKAG